MRVKAANGRVGRAFEHLIVGMKLLDQLLAGSNARHLYLDVVAHPTAREMDHSPGEIDDSNLLAHFEDEDVTALGYGSRLQNQLHRLADAHEEPGHAGVGDGHGPTAVDLTQEGGNHAASTAKDIAEANSAESALQR